MNTSMKLHYLLLTFWTLVTSSSDPSHPRVSNSCTPVTCCHDDHEAGRECVHSTVVEPKLDRFIQEIKTIPTETHRSANANFHPANILSFMPNEGPAPLRIYVEYQLDGLSSEKTSFMKEKLMPAVQSLFRRTLNVKKPIQGRLYLPWYCMSTFVGFPDYCHAVRQTCGDAKHNPAFFGPVRICEQPYDHRCTQIEHGPGVPDTDFVLYVTAKNDDGCAHNIETVASAGFCVFDQHNWYGAPNRPLAGIANFCPDNIKTDKAHYGYMLDTAVHEVFHALVMSNNLFSMFIDNTGHLKHDVIGHEEDHWTINTPAVVKATRDILDCSSIHAARLENEGGYGTANTHWERRFFMGEIMIGTSSVASRGVISNLTLALCEDSGWYEPNYKSAGVLGAVEHRGCEFCNRDCHIHDLSLADTFCWNYDKASQQRAVCTPDHTAVGYCKNDMSLIGSCAVIQAFKNTKCRNEADSPNITHVDLGMRNKLGARCFPVLSYKISRTEGRYTVYRSNIGATCFDTVCNEDRLYIHIPATSEHEEQYILCATGETIDLSLYGLGYDEGEIGPCPNNDFICKSWGCPEDCNGNGNCYDHKCYCDVGFVGEACGSIACPQESCNDDEVCDVNTGICYKQTKLKKKQKVKKKSQPVTAITPPEKSEVPKERKQKTSSFPEEETKASLSAPEVSPSPSPKKLKRSPSPSPFKAETGVLFVPIFEPEVSPSPKTIKKRSPPIIPPSPSPSSEEAPHESQDPEKGVMFVPWIEETKPSPSLPYKEPYKDPVYSERPTYDVPAYSDPDPSSPRKYASGVVMAVGLLSDCVMFEDKYNDLELHEDVSKARSAENGQWALTPYPSSRIVVNTRMDQLCIDTFTQLRPVWRLRALPGMKTISAISTLVSMATSLKKKKKIQPTNQRELTAVNIGVQMNKASFVNKSRRRFVLKRKMMRSLGLQDDQILERNFIIEVYQTRDNEAKHAFINNAIISNIVSQCACYLDRLNFPSLNTTDSLFKELAKKLLEGQLMTRVEMPNLILTLITSLSPPDIPRNDQSARSVAEVIAQTNRMMSQFFYSYDKLNLLEQVSKVTKVAQTKLCQMAAELAQGTLSPSDYDFETTYHSIQELVSAVEIPNIETVLASYSWQTNEANFSFPKPQTIR